MPDGWKRDDLQVVTIFPMVPMKKITGNACGFQGFQKSSASLLGKVAYQAGIEAHKPSPRILKAKNLKKAVRFGLALVASECGRYIAKAVNLASPRMVKGNEILQRGRVNDRKRVPKIATSKPPRGFGKVGFGSAHDFG
jgi:hypothetical protein